MCKDYRSIYDFKDYLRRKIAEIDRQIVADVISDAKLDHHNLNELKFSRQQIQIVMKYLNEFEKKVQSDIIRRFTGK